MTNENTNGELLIKAVEDNNESIPRLLHAGVDVNYTSKDGLTPLIAAVSKGSLSLVKQFLQYGCDVNMVPLLGTNQYGDSALHVASIKGNVEIIKALLNHGADVNVTSFGGRTPLMKACFHGNHEVVRELVSKGADVNQADYQQMSAFLYTCSRGHKSIAQYLLDNSADVNAQTWKGETGLVLAAQENQYDVLKLLLSNNCDINITTQPLLQGILDIPPGSTALHFTSRDGHVRMSRNLIQNGANINLQNFYLQTPLHYSCSEGHIKVTNLLLKSGCEVNLQNYAGETALFVAIEGKYMNIVELLLKYNANPNISTRSGVRPLIQAISMNSADLVKILVLANCDVKWCSNLIDTQSNKKEMRTIRCNSESREIMKILMLAGVGIHVVLKFVNEKYSPFPQIITAKDMEYANPAEKQLLNQWKECFILKQLCRVRIRRILGFDIQKKVDQLNLPALLKQYILLSELH